MRDLSEAVVVITGASSGIGRATAHAFAEEGASLVLAARRHAALDAAVAECHVRGADAVGIPTDVSDPAAVQRLASEALRIFGRIDVWVNNAGVMIFGRFEDTPAEDFRQLFETNFFGYVHGARAVLPHFLQRGHGILINNASIVGHVGQPFSSAYVASKFAVRGFSVALRQDLQDRPGIHVCTVLPGSTDTPLWQHTANYTGRAFRAFHPVSDPTVVARAVVGVVRRPRPEVVTGLAGKAMVLQHRVLPDLTERMMGRMSRMAVFTDRPAAPHAGALHQPMMDGLAVRGGWQSSRGWMWAALGAVAVPVGWALLRHRRTTPPALPAPV